MSAGCNKKSSKQNENTSETDKKVYNSDEGKVLTFKDWKTIKDSETKSKTVKKIKSRNANKTYNFVIVDCQGNAGFPQHYSNTPKTLNGMKKFDMRGNSFGTLKNGYNPFNYLSGFDRQNKFMNNNFNVPNTFDGQNANFTSGRNLPDNFFASDGIHRQRDMMQKPLPIPIKNDVKNKQLFQELDATHHQLNEKKKSSDDAPNNTKNDLPSSYNKILTTETTTSLGNEPKIYVPNPNASKDGKAFIPKPKLPEENLKISKEEKKQQWKEYREAMKPFKNREFYNAKRVVQRLGKKDINDLDEKEMFRLTNAREVMAAHKARLTAKYSDYVKAECKSNELGEVYVLKKPLLKVLEVGKGRLKTNQNYVNFSETNRNSVIEPRRKILGGYSSFKGFVPGVMLDCTTQRMG